MYHCTSYRPSLRYPGAPQNCNDDGLLLQPLEGGGKDCYQGECYHGPTARPTHASTATMALLSFGPEASGPDQPQWRN